MTHHVEGDAGAARGVEFARGDHGRQVPRVIGDSVLVLMREKYFLRFFREPPERRKGHGQCAMNFRAREPVHDGRGGNFSA